tara:strand:- start:5635 stop:5862 length:228 start_codon:yes stop_codon:yes gene_type:complete
MEVNIRFNGHADVLHGAPFVFFSHWTKSKLVQTGSLIKMFDIGKKICYFAKLSHNLEPFYHSSFSNQNACIRSNI